MKNFWGNSVAGRRALISVSTLALVCVSPAAAQDAATDGQQDEVEAEEQKGEIVVTGTSIRGISPTGSKASTISAAEMRETGLTSVTDIVRTLPQVQSLGASESPSFGQGAQANQQRGSSINLRGLGPNATLLLLDGNRTTPTGTVGTFTEANIVPVAALQRIEVVADGASAIYGSDAVAGVVNYVLRRDYDGIEVGGRYTGSRYWDQYGGYILAGAKWDREGLDGNVLFTFDYDRQNPFFGSDSPLIQKDLRPFGGNDNRLAGNAVSTGGQANIVVAGATPNPTLPNAGTFTYFTVPAGSTGVPSVSALLLNQPSLGDELNQADYIGQTDRYQAALVVNQKMSDWLELGVLATFSRRESLSRVPVFGSYTVAAANPFYISGIPGQPTGAPLQVRYGFLKDFGYATTENMNETYSVITKLNADFGGGWGGLASLNIGEDRVRRFLPTQINQTAAQSAINAGIFNPFDTRPLDASVLDRFRGNFVMNSDTSLRDILVKVDGPLFSLPAGSVRIAAGTEIINITNTYLAGTPQGAGNVFTITADTSIDRRITAFFGEVYIPIIGKEQDILAIRELTVTGAVRTEKYSDFGRTTNPRFGIDWTVSDGFRLRGSWSKSFRAPGLAGINPGVFSSVSTSNVTNNSGIAAIPIDITGSNFTRVLTYGGSNPNLGPETAESYSFGFDFEPLQIDGLQISATYYNYDYTNQISSLFLNARDFLASPSNAQLYAPFITPTPTPAGCTEGAPSTYNPLVAAALLLPNNGPFPLNGPYCNVRAVLDARDSNSASTKQAGFDGSINYRFDIDDNKFDLGFSGSYLLYVKSSFVANAPLIDLVNTINYPVSFRGRGNAGWSNGSYRVNLFGNVVGSYTNNLPITVAGVTRPISRVPAWVTFDLALSYSGAKTGIFKGLRASLNIQNLFDRDPPIVLTTNGGNNGFAFDNQNANPFGRVFRFQITKAF